jgi:hypothetical protein
LTIDHRVQITQSGGELDVSDRGVKRENGHGDEELLRAGRGRGCLVCYVNGA